jgi:alcohol dehydrogenase
MLRALRVTGGLDQARVVLDDRTPEPKAQPGEAIIRPRRVGVSEADLLLARTASDLTLGHEFVGVVEHVEPDETADRAGSGAVRNLVGKRVCGSISTFCRTCDMCRSGLSAHCRKRTVLGVSQRDGCFADLFALPVDNLVEAPESLDDDACVFAHQVSRALQLPQAVRIEGRPYVTVLGDNALALLTAQVLTRLNASVRVLGTVPERFALCEKWQVKHRHSDEAGRRQDQDIVVESTGDPGALALAMRLVRPRGTIVLQGMPAPIAVPAERQATLHADEAWSAPLSLTPVVSGELNIVGSRDGSIAEALAVMARAEIDVVSLITRRTKLSDGVEALRTAAQPEQIRVLMDA